MIHFFLGVTGHRQIGGASAAASLQGAAIREIGRLQQLLPATRLVMLSALAEGADRLVAQAALDCGCTLWALLPTSAEEYAKDFGTDASRREFYQLLGRSERALNASLAAGDGADCGLRPKIYVNVANLICRMSHMLIALWDGEAEEKPGGTSQVVRLFRSGEFSGANPSKIAYPVCGPVLHIPTARDGSQAGQKPTLWLGPVPGKPGKPVFAGNGKIGRSEFELGISRLGQFDAYCSGIELRPDMAAGYLLPPEYPWRADPLMTTWLGWFAATEEVSNRAAKLRLRNLMLVVLLFLVFTLSTLAYGGIAEGAWPLDLGLACLAAAALGYARHQHNGIEELWAGGRVLAECLRVAIVQRAAKVDQDLHHVASEEGLAPTDWIGLALRAVDSSRLGAGAAEGISQETSRSAVSFWCVSQQDYFADKANKIDYHHRRGRRYARISAGCIIAALAVYLATLAVAHQLFPSHLGEAAQVAAWVMFAYWGLLSVGALVASFSQVMGHPDHVSDYQFALVKFRMAGSLLSTEDGASSAEVAALLGRVAIREVIGWLRLHRGRPLRLPF